MANKLKDKKNYNFLVVLTLAVIAFATAWFWPESSEAYEAGEEQVQLYQPPPQQREEEPPAQTQLPSEQPEQPEQAEDDPIDTPEPPREEDNGQEADTDHPQHQPQPQANTDPPENPDDWRLILVSPRHPLGYDFSPPRLETISGHHQVDSRIIGSLREMIASAAGDGITLVVTSAYRPASRQSVLHNQQIERFMGYGHDREEAVAVASTIVLPPGTSEHQTGLAIDIVTPEHQALTAAFADTPAGIWLAGNAHRYGFILRYPRDSMHITGVIFEPWHFRYVGREHARAIFEGGYILEEYLLSRQLP